LNHLMTGAQLPLYVTLHVIVMTSYSCTAPEADRFVEQLVLSASRNVTFRNQIGLNLLCINVICFAR